MADAKTTALTEAFALAPDDMLYLVNDPAGSALSKKIATKNAHLPIVTVSFSATPAFDCNLGNLFKITLTANITSWTISNAQSGQRITLLFIQDGTGGRTLAGSPASVKLAGASFTLTTPANKRDSLTLYYDGTDWNEETRSVNL